MSEPEMGNNISVKDVARLKHIRDFQLKRIQNMLCYAYENVPLYRHKYDVVGIKPGDIQTLSDFKSIPLLTKQELQMGFPEDILSKKINRNNCYIVTTSGHSGSPVNLYRKKSELSLLPFIYCMGYPLLPQFIKSLSGLKTGRRVSVIIPQDEAYDIYRIVKIFSRLPFFFRQNLQFIDTKNEVETLFFKLKNHKPDVIISDLITIRNIITFAENKGVNLPPVKVLFVGSELIDGNSRNLLQNSFGAKVIEHYGSEEAETIAMECPHGQGLHLFWRTNYIELLENGREVPAGTPGQVVITNLINTATPIIRYSGLGDIATISSSPCTCQKQNLLLKMVDGRMVDSFILPDGRVIHPFNLTTPLENFPVWRYQIRQEKMNFVRILIVPIDRRDKNINISQDTELSQQILSKFRALLGSSIDIEVKIVDDIPQIVGSRHKLQPVISLVNRQASL
jgi:phenylacetate-CoA ligase